MKRQLLCILAFLLMIPFTSCTSQGVPQISGTEGNAVTDPKTTDTQDNENTVTTPDENTLDIYLIAGQSNASGSTAISSVSKILEFAPELELGFSNVHYAGTIPGGGSYYREFPWNKTTYGLGITANHIGPEAGMAKALSVYYNQETGRHAGIIKYALGGTHLLNVTSANWVSPTSKQALAESEITEATGKLYQGFLDQVEKNVSEIFAYGGYTSVRICGLYWMQGCNDRDMSDKYPRAFLNFATDIRKDLSEIMKKYTNSDNDCGASEMPIIVGTISNTHNVNSSTDHSTNIKFVQMQKMLDQIVSNCYILDNSEYKISEIINGESIIYGSDKGHWNQADMLEIGENAGKLMLYRAGITQKDPFPDPAS